MNIPSNSQIPLPLSHGDKAAFDNFWVGHNSELVSAIRASIELGEPKLIYFYGPSSVGKSHLLFAALKLAKEEVVHTSYLSLSESVITPSMLDALDAGHLICIDNVHTWAGEEAAERALFTLFEQVRHRGGSLLLSARTAPDNSGFQLPDLISRLASGLVYAVPELTEDQQFHALKLRANNRGLSISDDAVKYLLSRSSRDTGKLFSLLDEIDRTSLIEKRRVTIPFLQTILNKETS